eukprot:372915_1
MQTTAISQRLSDLSTVDTTTRTKATKLLSKICDKILSNPSEPKYQDLNFVKIQKKLSCCPSSLSLLYDIGFKVSNDGLRLKWVQNETNSRLLHQLSQTLHLDLLLPNLTLRSDNKGSTSHTIKILHALFHRTKAPNDLSLSITEYTTLIQRIQNEHTPGGALLIQNLNDLAEPMKFVHRVETAAQNDAEGYELLDAFKKMLRMWSLVDYMSTDTTATAKLEEAIMQMKHLIELYLACDQIMQLSNDQVTISNDQITISMTVGAPKETISSVEDNDDAQFVDELLTVLPGIDRNDLNEGNMNDLLAAVDDDDVPQEDKNILCIQESVASNTCTSGDSEEKQETDLDMVFQLAVSIMSQEGK